MVNGEQKGATAAGVIALFRKGLRHRAAPSPIWTQRQEHVPYDPCSKGEIAPR